MTHPGQRHQVVPAAYIIFRKADKILLLRRANTGYRDGDFSLPAGHVGGVDERGGESALQAAIREAKEEVGVDIRPEDLKLVHTLHRRSTEPSLHERIDLFFEAKAWSGELQNAEPHKCDELRWADAEALPANMIPEVRHALDCISRQITYGELGFRQS